MTFSGTCPRNVNAVRGLWSVNICSCAIQLAGAVESSFVKDSFIPAHPYMRAATVGVGCCSAAKRSAAVRSEQLLSGSAKEVQLMLQSVCHRYCLLGAGFGVSDVHHQFLHQRLKLL